MAPNIAFFVPTLAGGGAERVVVTLANECVLRGYAVDLVLSNAIGPLLPLIHHDVRLVDLGARRVALSIPALARYLVAVRPAFLISGLPHCDIAAILSKYMTLSTTKVIACMHSDPRKGLGDRRTLGGKILLPGLIRLAYPRADGVIAVSHGVARDLADVTKLPPERIKVIYNPVDIPNILERARYPCNHGWIKKSETPLILGVGRLSRQKDFGSLIQAFALVRKHRSARLMILGEGMERNHLESLVDSLGIGADVQMPGFVDNPYPFMAGASVFVLSSEWESFGIVLVEALAVGTPIVSTNCHSGPAEILDGGKYGRLVAVGDISAMAHAIDETLDAPIDARLLNMRAQAFSADKAVGQYLDLLAQINGLESHNK